MHGYPRYTKDIDIWIDAQRDNAARIVKALDDFGFASLGLKEADFLELDTIIQLGYPPNRIDIITSLPGVDFDVCYSNKVEVDIDHMMVTFIDVENLKINKLATGRAQDIADVENLG